MCTATRSPLTKISTVRPVRRTSPGKLNVAAAQGISDFLLFGFIKSVGLEIVRVPAATSIKIETDEGRRFWSSSAAFARCDFRRRILDVTRSLRQQGVALRLVPRDFRCWHHPEVFGCANEFCLLRCCRTRNARRELVTAFT